MESCASHQLIAIPFIAYDVRVGRSAKGIIYAEVSPGDVGGPRAVLSVCIAIRRPLNGVCVRGLSVYGILGSGSLPSSTRHGVTIYYPANAIIGL